MNHHHTWVRWMLNAAGLGIGLGANKVVDWFNVPALGLLLFPSSPRADVHAYVTVLLYLSLLSVLCLVSSWGLKRAWTWAVWGGRLASFGLLLGFPWLTPLGIYGLYALWDPPKKQPSVARKPAYWITAVFRLIGGGLMIFGWGMVIAHSRDWGLPRESLGMWVFGVWALGELVEITVHEFGHTLAAWGVGFRVLAICIGPITVWKDEEGRRRCQLALGNVFGRGGYVGAVPVSDENVRSSMILVVLAGPLFSLMGGLALFSLALASPGTPWERYWDVLAALALLFVCDLVPNLVPVNETDGALLFHLLFWTDKGRRIATGLKSGKLRQDATARRGCGDLEGEVDLLVRILEDTVASGETRPEVLAVRHQELGFGLLRLGRWLEAERHLRTSADLLERLPDAHPLIAANTWMGLQSIYHAAHRSSEAEQAGQASLAAFEKVLQLSLDPASHAKILEAMARIHMHRDRWTDGLREIDKALNYCPLTSNYAVERASILAHKAQFEFCLGCPERGAAAADEAVGLIRAGLRSSFDRAACFQSLCEVAKAYMGGDRAEEAVPLLREAAAGLEAVGLTRHALSCRFLLMRLLRHSGELDAAEAALPDQRIVPADLRDGYYEARGRLRVAQDRAAEGILDLEECLRLAKENPNTLAVPIATAECGLAEAYLDGGREEEARSTAERALAVLRDARHPDESDALLTLTLLAWRRTDDAAEALFGKALGLMRDAALIDPAAKARWLDSASRRLNKAGRAREAQRTRDQAMEQRRMLGLVPAYSV